MDEKEAEARPLMGTIFLVIRLNTLVDVISVPKVRTSGE